MHLIVEQSTLVSIYGSAVWNIMLSSVLTQHITAIMAQDQSSSALEAVNIDTGKDSCPPFSSVSSPFSPCMFNHLLLFSVAGQKNRFCLSH